MKILVLDNYDSFVYNLVHIIRELGYGDEMDIIRNDKIALDDVDTGRPSLCLYSIIAGPDYIINLRLRERRVR